MKTPSSHGDLVKVLVAFAAWRPCDACGVLALCVDENLRTDTRRICPRCEERLGRLCLFPSTALLAAAFLLAVLP